MSEESVDPNKGNDQPKTVEDDNQSEMLQAHEMQSNEPQTNNTIGDNNQTQNGPEQNRPTPTRQGINIPVNKKTVTATVAAVLLFAGGFTLGRVTADSQDIDPSDRQENLDALEQDWTEESERAIEEETGSAPVVPVEPAEPNVPVSPTTTEAPYIPMPLPGQDLDLTIIYCDRAGRVLDVFAFHEDGLADKNIIFKPGDECPENSTIWNRKRTIVDSVNEVPRGGLYNNGLADPATAARPDQPGLGLGD